MASKKNTVAAKRKTDTFFIVWHRDNPDGKVSEHVLGTCEASNANAAMKEAETRYPSLNCGKLKVRK